MKAVLLRAASASLVKPPINDQDSGAGIFFPAKNCIRSPRPSLHLEIGPKKSQASGSVRRTVSDTELVFVELKSSRSAPARIAEEKTVDDLEGDELIGGGSWVSKKGLSLLVSEKAAEVLPESNEVVEELEFSGGGMGKGPKAGGGSGNGRGDLSKGDAGQSRIGDYYRQMLLANPENPLLLMNYGKFLHEVEKDFERAEELYGRAILASPGDGEVLSLYGKLIWDSHKDQQRADAIFSQAVKASPDNCYVLGAYAHFLWDADDDDEDTESDAKTRNVMAVETPPLIKAF